jgi:putative hydrolase of the HAD superfamily
MMTQTPDSVFFDLDDTLYPRSSGLMQAIGENIHRYLIERMHVPAGEAKVVRRHLREKHGTALRGLQQEGYPVDVDEFLRFVHDIPLDSVTPDPQLRAALLALPLRRAVLTNSNIEHASRVLKHMRIDDCFERIIDIRALGYVCKPATGAYQLALDMLDARAQTSILVEDNTVNTAPARAMGMTCIVVDCPLDAGADYAVPDIGAALSLVRTLCA